MRSAYPAVFFCALACASAPSASRLSSTGVQPSTVAIPVAGDASSGRGQLLTGAFLTEYFGGETLHDVLRRRAPLYLRARANPANDFTGRTDPIAVYINGSFSGSLEVLQGLPANQVFSVDRLSGADAMMRFGPKHGSGALLVRLVRND